MTYLVSSTVCFLLLVLSGCYSVTQRFQPDNEKVQAQLHGEDCAFIIFGLGGGNADLEEAKRHATQIDQSDQAPPGPHAITKVRRVEISEEAFILVVTKCVVVIGEP